MRERINQEQGKGENIILGFLSFPPSPQNSQGDIEFPLSLNQWAENVTNRRVVGDNWEGKGEKGYRTKLGVEGE